MPKSVLTLGTFDGVHLGHRALIRKVVLRAKAIKAKSVVLAFDMPPRHAGEAPLKPVLLTTLPEKLQILKALGIDRVHVLVFNRATSSTTPEDFFDHTIQGRYGAREMVVGPRVAFGKNRSGRLPLLQDLGRRRGVLIHIVSSIAGGKGPISSRRIRALLTRGQIEKANALLGYPYSASGTVVHGDRRGRRLGFPTANIEVDAGKILPRGVYWVKVHPAHQIPLTAAQALKGMDGLCNIGTRPTFNRQASNLRCEVFLTHPSSTRLYGRKLRVVFLRRIRAEKRFSSSAALTTQIQKDLHAAVLYKKAHFSI